MDKSIGMILSDTPRTWRRLILWVAGVEMRGTSFEPPEGDRWGLAALDRQPPQLTNPNESRY